MNTPRRVIFVLVPLVILLLPVAVYLADRATSSEEVARNVSVAGVPVGGMSEADAELAVQAHEQELRQSTGVFTVNGEAFKLSPVTIGLTANTDRAIDEAMQVRRDSNPFANFWSWIRSFSEVEDVQLEVAFSDSAIDEQLDEWEVSAIPNPAFEGAIGVVDGAVDKQYPAAGEKIDRTVAKLTIEAEMSRLEKAGATLPIITSTPMLTDADIDAAAAELNALIDSDITMISDDVGFRAIFFQDQLAEAARAELRADGSGFDTYFDEGTVLGFLELRRSEFEIEPVDAQLDIDLGSERIRVIPGRKGTLLDTENLLIEMKAAALGNGVGPFPLLVGADPEFTTEEAEEYTNLKVLAKYTTDHPAREPRVTNIQQMARDVDGAIVLPGREFSINDRVGQRTEAKGYVAAPAIINGEPYCCDHPANIGGGVSQFGTTLFNAVFFACLEDVAHRPHSLYFTRYPEGREATLGVPGPDVRFRNNTDSPVVIKTAYTGTSITVAMFGDNGGKKCTDITREREAIVEYEEELVADEEDRLRPGQRERERSGINGFLVRVDRLVTYPDGREEIDLNLVWRYQPLSERYIVHPCEVTGEPVNCPIQLPSLTNQAWSDVLGTLEGLGVLAARVDESVDDPALDGIVIAQDPSAGEWVPVGTTITLTVGVYSGDGDGDGGGGGEGDGG